MALSGDAARMDAIYAHQRHFYDLTRKYYLLGRDHLIARLEVPDGGTVLEVGCGTGRNLIAVAKRYPSAKLFGFDISDAMLRTAQTNVVKAGLVDRIILKQGDATNFDATSMVGGATFDRVFFSYTLSMIPDWQAVLERGVAVTGGALHLIDFGQQEALPRWFKRGLHAWLAKFDVKPRISLREVVSGLGMKSEFEPLYRGYAWSATLNR